MRFLCILLLGLMVGPGAHAQSLKKPSAHLPANLTPRDYEPGKVLVKVNEKFKKDFQGSTTTMRSSSLLNGSTMKSLSKGRSSKTARLAPFIPKIDMSRYFEISYDPARPIEEVIDELYASGYIEIAEPAYKMHMQFTPNDPGVASQYYLSKIRALEAWDITKGSSDIVIAIVDSGVDIDHPDLASQLYINTADPVNGIDDDNNGYIDDYRGWDFSGADTLNAFDPNFVGDNDPSILKSGGGFTHGTQVGGCASAAPNNGVGGAGVGYNTKLLFTKHFADNQPSSDVSYSSNLYLGVLYAAENGAKIINCSWGSNFRSQVYQDVITHVTLDLGCLVVSAAGNSNVSDPLYPAAYDYVLAVAATDSNDHRADFTNYGSYVDLSAPGVDTYTTVYNDSYNMPDGTSFSSPIVAGAAALVWEHFPDFTPLQVAEQLRVTADESIYTVNPAFKNQLGKGRLDIYSALTTSSPSIRALDYKLVNAAANAAEPGDPAFLYLNFINYLQASSGGLEISISTTSSAVTITKGKINPGIIPSGATVTNSLTPFELTLSSTVSENITVDLLITYSDGAYQDHQVFTFVPNPSYRDVDENRVITTVTSIGRLGYQDPSNSQGGNGFVYNDASILFEMGLMMGSSSSTILNTIRGMGTSFDQDFFSTQRIREITPGERSYSEIFGQFSNSKSPANQKVKVDYRSLVWRDSVRSKFVIMEYRITNPQAIPLTNFYFGIFSDWDISFGGAGDAAQWNADLQLGYVFPKQSSSLPHAGIQLLTDHPVYFAIDNDQNIAGNPFGLYDGYTDIEKFTSISTNRFEAGNSSAVGNDVSHVISAGPFSINPNEEITVAFALHAADNLDDLLNSAKYADSVYNFTLKAPRPAVDTVETCYGADATLIASGAGKYKWYDSFTGGDAIATGSQLNVTNVVRDTTLFVSNADASYESLRTAAHIRVQAKPQILTSRSTTLCEGDVITLSVEEASEYLWSTGATTQSIEVSTAGDYHVDVFYNNGVLNCESTSEDVTVTILSKPGAAFWHEEENSENPFVVQFIDESTGASQWFWDFGDGTTSQEQSPVHTFAEGGDFDVVLTVTAGNGCQDSGSETLSIVLSAEEDLQRAVQVYPVPAKGNEVTLAFDGITARRINLSLLTTQGDRVEEKRIDFPASTFHETLDIKNLRSGIYFLQIQVDGKMLVKKVVVTR